jgi:hypothetical protein
MFLFFGSQTGLRLSCIRDLDSRLWRVRVLCGFVFPFRPSILIQPKLQQSGCFAGKQAQFDNEGDRRFCNRLRRLMGRDIFDRTGGMVGVGFAVGFLTHPKDALNIFLKAWCDGSTEGC